MKATTIKTILNAITTIIAALGADAVESLSARASMNEERSRFEILKDAWFAKYGEMPTSYNQCNNAMVIKKKGDNKVYVATLTYTDEGEKKYVLRSIFTSKTKIVSASDVEVVYRGSVERCWLTWFEMNGEARQFIS